MMRGSVKQPTGKSEAPKAQAKTFIDAARALGCDESEERFDAALAKVAQHKTQPQLAKESKLKSKRTENKATDRSGQ
jgi:hypothetical protein